MSTAAAYISKLAELPRRRSGGLAAPSFVEASSGNVALIFALLLPVLLLIIGGAIDFGSQVAQKRKLQSIADVAAVTAAKELSMVNSYTQNVVAVVDAVVTSSVTANSAQGQSPAISVTTNVIDQTGQPMQVQVQLSQQPRTIFLPNNGPISANAVAVGTPNVCVLALDSSSMGTIYLQKNAKVVGQNCGVYSNSTHPNGIKAFNSSMLSANVICSAGGKAGGQGNFSPQPLVDCPQFADPLSGRPEPSVESCVTTNLVITNKTTTLSPGTYCGGITVNGTSSVTFSPGIYVLKDGPLYVDQSACVNGINTGFYFNGPKSVFFFNTGTTISLTAPKDGVMAGILFFGSRAQTGLTHKILSDNAHQILGTVYLPTSALSIDANQPIADQSAYTAIVALQLTANSGPTVTLNTNYNQTDVPVPDGIRGAGQPVSLVQ